MDITKLSETKLRALQDKRYAATCDMTKRLIAAGHGLKTGRDLREMAKSGTDPLLLEYVAVTDAFYETIEEIDSRKRWHGSLKPIKRSA